MTDLQTMPSEKLNAPGKPDLARVFVISIILGLLSAYVIIAVRLIRDPGQNRTTDFLNYYSAASIARQQGYAYIYDVDQQRLSEAKLVGFDLPQERVLLFSHPPFLVPIAVLLFNDIFEVIFLRWMLCLILVLLISYSLLTALLPDSPGPWRLLFSGSTLFFPVFISLIQGQDSVFLLLGASIFLWGMLNRHETGAGIGLSLLTLRPQLALFFILPLFFWSRRALKSYLLASACLGLFSFLLVGTRGSMDYIYNLELSASGDWFGINESDMVNLLGLVRRALPGLDSGSVRQAAWALYAVAFVWAAWFFSRSRIPNENKFGLGIIVYLLASPHLHYHDLTLLLIPAFILVVNISRARPLLLKSLSAAAAAISLVMFLTNYVPIFFFNLPYLLAGLLAYGLARTTGRENPHPTAQLST